MEKEKQHSCDKDNIIEGTEFRITLDQIDILSESESCSPRSDGDSKEVAGSLRILKLGPQDLHKEMEMEIKEAAQLTCLSPSSVRILLNTFNWDKAKIVEKTMYGESFMHLRDIGIIISPVQPVNPPVVPTPGMLQHGGGTCMVCRRMTNVLSMVFTLCDHWFCIRCFQKHLIVEIEIGDTSHFQCPYKFCTMFLDDDTVLRTLPPHLMEGFKQLCLNDFVNRSTYRASCPTDGCENITKPATPN